MPVLNDKAPSAEFELQQLAARMGPDPLDGHCGGCVGCAGCKN